MKRRAILEKGKKAPQRKFVVWVREFAGKFVYRNDVIVGVVIPTNEAMPKLITVKSLKQNPEQFWKYDQKYNT